MDRVISSRSFLLLAHYATFAYQDLLYEFLTNNNAELVTKINLPLPEQPYLKQIEITQNKGNKVIESRKVKSFYKPPFFAYILQSFQLLFLVANSSKNYDVIIAQDSLLALLSIILRMIGKCRKVVFYSHGIDNTRFSLGIANTIYKSLDRFAARNSDFNWFLSRKMVPIRKEQGVPLKRMFWIPASIPVDSISRKKSVKNHKVVFLGTVNRKNGAHFFPAIVQRVKREIPDIVLDIMGNGDLFSELKKRVKRMKLERHINFLDSLSFKEFSPKLTNYSLGLAPYEPSTENLTPLSDSLKMRVYLAAGLPVVITEGFHFSDEVKKYDLGFTVDFSVDSFSRAITKLLTDKSLNDKIRKRALDYSEKYDLTKIYKSTFNKILK